MIESNKRVFVDIMDATYESAAIAPMISHFFPSDM